MGVMQEDHTKRHCELKVLRSIKSVVVGMIFSLLCFSAHSQDSSPISETQETQAVNPDVPASLPSQPPGEDMEPADSIAVEDEYEGESDEQPVDEEAFAEEYADVYEADLCSPSEDFKVIREKVMDLIEDVNPHYDVAFYRGVPGVELNETDLRFFEQFTQNYVHLKEDVESYLSRGFEGVIDQMCLILEKFHLITAMISIADKIVSAQIRLGENVLAIDLRPYNLLIPFDSFTALKENHKIRDLRRPLGPFIVTEVPANEEEQASIRISFNRASLQNRQMEYEIFQDSQRAWVWMILSPILEVYYRSLMQIQDLQGLTDPEPPPVGHIVEDGYLSFSLLKMKWEAALASHKEATFRSALTEALRQLMYKEGQNLDEMPHILQPPSDDYYDEWKANGIYHVLDQYVHTDWQEMRLFNPFNPRVTYSVEDAVLSIPMSLRHKVNEESLQIVEFKSFPEHFADQIASWPLNLYCKEFEEGLVEQSLNIDTYKADESTNPTSCLKSFKFDLANMFQEAKQRSLIKFVDCYILKGMGEAGEEECTAIEIIPITRRRSHPDERRI